MGVRSSLQVSEQVFFRALALVLLLAAGLLLYLELHGLPRWAATALLRRLDTGTFAVEADGVRISPLRGLTLEQARVYRRRVVGPPAVEAGEIHLSVDLLAAMKGIRGIRGIRIRDGLIRPDLISARIDGRPVSADRRLRARLEIDNCVVQGVEIERLRGWMRVDGAVSRFESIEATLHREGLRGSLRGSGRYDTGTKLLKLHGSVVMDPHLVLPALEERGLDGMARVIRRFRFDRDLPEGTFDVERVCRPGGHMTVQGRVHLRSATYREVPVLQADAVLRTVNDGTNRTVTLAPLSVARREGSARGDLLVDLEGHTVRFDARSALDPQALRRMLNVLRSPAWDEWEFSGPVSIDARGTAGYRSNAATEFTATIAGTGATFRRYRMDNYAMRMQMRGATNRVSDVRVGMYGGEVVGAARFVLPETDASNTLFDAALKMRDMDFKQVAGVLARDTDRDYSGRLSGELALRGMSGDRLAETVEGGGLVNITDGKVFLLPVFGGLSSFMTRIIPGLDFVLRQSDAHATFLVGDGRISMQEVNIEGDVLSLKGSGHYTFAREVDYHAQVKLMKEHSLVARLVRVLTYPISKLFEFRLRGTLDEPRWYPVNFSTDLLERIGFRNPDP